MGIDYEAQSIIGVRIPSPIVKRKIRGCRHTETQSKFCSECGQPMFHSEEGFHPIIEAFEYDETNAQGYSLVWTSHQYQNECVVGCYSTTTDSNRNHNGKHCKKTAIEDLDMPAIKAGLKSLLKELYNEKEFGLWTILQAG